MTRPTSEFSRGCGEFPLLLERRATRRRVTTCDPPLRWYTFLKGSQRRWDERSEGAISIRYRFLSDPNMPRPGRDSRGIGCELALLLGRVDFSSHIPKPRKAALHVVLERFRSVGS